MKGFGFPHQKDSQYKADTSQRKNELINILTHSQKLWGLGKDQQSLVYLRKAVNVLEFIIENQTIEKVKQAYVQKLKQLKGRLKSRQQNRQEYIQGSGSGGGTATQKQGGFRKQNNKQNNILKGQLMEAIITQKPNVHWQDVSGLENAKSALKEALFTGSRQPWKGILLYGPPGTGKTFLAKACATQAQGTFFSVSSSDLMSKYVGQSQRLIKQLFQLARQKKPSIIFIDQIDSMCGNRSDGQNQSSRRVKTEFLVQMQGVGHDDNGVLVLGATNLPWALDPAVRRRFQRRIYIPLPEYQARLGMIKKNMKGNPNNMSEKDFNDLANRTQNFSGSDISILVRDAVYEPVRRFQAATKFKKTPEGKFMPCRQGEDGQAGSWTEFPKDKIDIGIIQKEDFLKALTKTKASVDQKQLKQYQQWTQSFGQDG